MKKTPSIVLADDHAEILQKISNLLRSQFAVVATARDGNSAVVAAAKAKPDLVILDINMPLLDGFTAAREIKKLGLPSKVLFLTMHDDPAYEEFAMELGASGLVLKSRASSDLVEAIETALAGGTFFTREKRAWRIQGSNA